MTSVACWTTYIFSHKDVVLCRRRYTELHQPRRPLSVSQSAGAAGDDVDTASIVSCRADWTPVDCYRTTVQAIPRLYPTVISCFLVLSKHPLQSRRPVWIELWLFVIAVHFLATSGDGVRQWRRRRRMRDVTGANYPPRYPLISRGRCTQLEAELPRHGGGVCGWGNVVRSLCYGWSGELTGHTRCH